MSAETLGAVLAELEGEGYTGHLRVTGADVVCGTCSSVLAPEDVLVHRFRRLEGASDPDDMLAVVGAACPGCGTDGTLVLGYGPAADPDQAAVLARLNLPDDVPRAAVPEP
jgi:hypothetical protein